MKFSKLNNPTVFKNVSITKYLIDWTRKVSGPQLKTKNFLLPFWENSCVLEEFLIPGSKLRIDLMNITSKVIIEVSPDEVHTKFNSFMHRSRPGFLGVIKRDRSKQEWAEQNGFQYICLNSADIKNLTVEMFKQKGLEL